mmetsp:Transcript_24327/g.68387  ORF Transcript_24327/g.68387 Transcript_24327/m.68387 type:complete len:214 (-) Transcript_24327:51-692(-)
MLCLVSASCLFCATFLVSSVANFNSSSATLERSVPTSSLPADMNLSYAVLRDVISSLIFVSMWSLCSISFRRWCDFSRNVFRLISCFTATRFNARTASFSFSSPSLRFPFDARVLDRSLIESFLSVDFPLRWWISFLRRLFSSFSIFRLLSSSQIFSSFVLRFFFPSSGWDAILDTLAVFAFLAMLGLDFALSSVCLAWFRDPHVTSRTPTER